MERPRAVWHRCAQLAQWGALLSAPSLLKPHWESIVAAFGGPKWANVLGVLAIHLCVLLVGNLLFLVLYRAQSPFFERHKVSPGPWPWMTGDAARQAAFTRLVWQGVGLTVVNNAISVPLAILNYETSVGMGHSASLSTFPSTLTVLLHLLAFTVVEDALFYWTHRTLHTPALYPHVHKLHHRFTHSVSIAAEATHPVEFVVGNVLPFAAGPLLLGSHLVTLWVWTAFRIGETVTNHSGYDLPWSLYGLLPFQGSATAHDVHHQKFTRCFGSLYSWWDDAMGTGTAALPSKGCVGAVDKAE